MDQDKHIAEFLTRQEAADFFGITLPTLHKWTKEGLIQAYDLGGRVYYKRSELLESFKRRG
jgi:excisionase family DNA binding protein